MSNTLQKLHIDTSTILYFKCYTGIILLDRTTDIVQVIKSLPCDNWYGDVTQTPNWLLIAFNQMRSIFDKIFNVHNRFNY